MPLSSDIIELPPVVSLPKHEEASIPIDFIISDVQPLSSLSVESSALVVILNDLLLPHDFHVCARAAG